MGDDRDRGRDVSLLRGTARLLAWCSIFSGALFACCVIEAACGLPEGLSAPSLMAMADDLSSFCSTALVWSVAGVMLARLIDLGSGL